MSPQPINFSTGYTGYTVAWRRPGELTETAIASPTVTPQATPTGDGSADADVPSLRVQFGVGSLDSLPSEERIVLIVVATATDGRDVEFQFPARVED